MYTNDMLPHNYQKEVKAYFRPKVREGIKFLNEHSPTWKKEINKQSLRMERCDACILGQTFGDYFDAMNDFVVEGLISEMENRDAFSDERGFYIHYHEKLIELAEGYNLWEEYTEQDIIDIEWSLLGDTWVEEIEKCATSPENPS